MLKFIKHIYFIIQTRTPCFACASDLTIINQKLNYSCPRFNPMGGQNNGHNGDGQGYPNYPPTNAPVNMYNHPPDQAQRPPNPDQIPPNQDIPAPTEEMVANCFHHTQGEVLMVV